MGEARSEPLEGAPPAGAEVSLREITRDTLWAVLRLKVREDQAGLVADNAVSIAQAHFHDEAWFRAVYADDVPVGFLMLSLEPAKPEYSVWRFMIDARYQGNGFGRRALELAIGHVRTLPDARELLLSYVPIDGNPRPFYERLGFAETGAVEDGEVVMRLPLDA